MVFLALTFKKFICGFANITEPLTQLLRNNATLVWKAPQQEAFLSMKIALTSSSILRYFVEGAYTKLRTDTNDYGLGAVLAQHQSTHGNKRVVAYGSRTLFKCEENYSTTEK